MTPDKKPPRPVYSATVVRTEPIAVDMVRVFLTGESLGPSLTSR